LQIISSSHPIATITLAQITLGNSALIDLSTNNTNSDYIKQVIEYNKRIMQQIDKIILVNEYDMMINNSYFKLISNIKIRQSIYVKRVQYSMIKKLEINNIWTYGDLHKEAKTKSKPYLWFEVTQISKSFPKPWKKLLDKAKKEYSEGTGLHHTKTNIWKQYPQKFSWFSRSHRRTRFSMKS
jgi:hypothetical protein